MTDLPGLSYTIRAYLASLGSSSATIASPSPKQAISASTSTSNKPPLSATGGMPSTQGKSPTSSSSSAPPKATSTVSNQNSATGSSPSSSSASSQGTTSSTTSSGGSSSSNLSASDTAASNQMLASINQARVAAGESALGANQALAQLAQERAQAMITNNYFSENSPVYGLPIQMESQAGIKAESLGAENIAEAPTISEAFALLMASPPHKANIMASYFTQVGIGAAYSPSTGWVVSELFAGPSN